MILETKLEDGRYVEYYESFWTGRRKLSIEGKELKKTGKRVFCDDENGSIVEYTAKGSFLTGVTLITNNGKSLVLAKNKWYDWFMIFLPLVGMVAGVAFCGALGGGLSAVFCLLAATINASISRSKLNAPVKLILQLVVAVVANAIWFVIYFIVAVLILGIIAL